MNAVERFWNARRQGDWEAIGSQLRSGARIRLRQHAGDATPEEFLGLLQFLHRGATTTVERFVRGESHQFAVFASVAGEERTIGCAGFYELHEGLIAVIDETWFVPGAGGVLEGY